MHNHNNNNDKGTNSMMWMMVICCAVPLLLILLFGASGRALGAPTWIVFGGVAVMVVAHFFMMGKSHGHNHDEEHKENVSDDPNNKDTKDGKSHSGHGCCH